MNTTIDPITFAVLKNAMDSIVDEIAYTVVRTARSEIVKDVMDYSAALCDRHGRMVAQAKTIALHLGAVPEAMAAVLEKYGHDLNPGDAVILNDPYRGGMHLPDIFVFQPVFAEERIVAFAGCVAHHVDVGGRRPGSNAPDSTEIFQEGLQIDKRLVQLRPRDALAHYNLACSYALLKRPDQSLKTLRRAVELGYRDFRYMAEDHDLDAIRHDPRFRQLLREFEER